MDQISQDDISPPTESKLYSPLSPKRPRIDCSMPEEQSEKSRFDFPELLTFRKTFNAQLSTNMLQKSAGVQCTTTCGGMDFVKPETQPQDSNFLVNPITTSSTSDNDEVNTGSSNACFIAPERTVPLVKDEEPPLKETDKLSSYPPDDAGGALAESHSLKDVSADTSSHPDCDRLGKSLGDETPCGCNLPAGDDRDGRQVQNTVSQIQAFSLSSSDEEVRCLSDCTYNVKLCNTGFYNTWSQSAEAEESNQRDGEDGFNENALLGKVKEEANSLISFIDYANSESFYSIPEEDPSGKMAEGVKDKEEISDLQICANENVAACNWETKAENENEMSKNSIPSAAEWAEGSVLSHDMVLATNIVTKTVSLEADDFCGAKEAHAAGKMIAKTESETADHTTEAPMSSRISQEPTEGDNDAGPVGVIDPAIWSESDREARQKCCNSESTEGVQLSPFVKICEIEIPLCPDVQPSQEDSGLDQSRTHLCQDEKEGTCQTYTEPQPCPNTTENILNNTSNDDNCQWKSTPSSSQCESVQAPPAGDKKTQGSPDAVGHPSTEQDQSGLLPDSLDHLLTQEVEYLWAEIAEMYGLTEINEREDTKRYEMKSDEQRKEEHSMDSKVKPLQQSEKHKEDPCEMSVGDFFNEWEEIKISNTGKNLTHIELGNTHECLCDHPYTAVIPVIEVTTEGNERKEEEENGVKDISAMSVEVVDSQQKEDQTEVSPDECISEQTEATMSKQGDTLILNSQHEQSNELCGFSDDQIGPKTDALLPLTFPAPSDAFVPATQELRHSQNADKNPTAIICSDRFSPEPSAFTFCARVSGAFDTFEKIQLSLEDDGDDDAGFSNNPLLSSLSEQLLKTPQQQPNHLKLEAESSEHEEVPQEEDEEGKEEDVERFECHTDYVANGLSSCDYSCDELSNPISAADVPVPGLTEHKPNCESAFKSSEGIQDELQPQSTSCIASSKCDSPASDVNNKPRFEMKKEFDNVLKELNLFFDVSKSEFGGYSRESSPVQCSDVTEVWESDHTDFKEPLRGYQKDTSSDDVDEVRTLDECVSDPVVSCTPGSGDDEQEVPLGSCQEAPMYTAETHREPQEMESKKKTWSPSFMCQTFLEQLSHKAPEPTRRLEPLRTCTRPLRVGLSKRAKTKHLHRPHPYREMSEM
nr:RAD51-associated protein 2 [Labrus bergylta]